MKLIRWLDERTGGPTLIRRFLDEEVPASSGWPQVFGSVALFLFLTQAFTGILLAFNYAPTPAEAYSSLQYIMGSVAGGRMIHGLHHWGATMMVVVVGIHMAQVFIYGAYKKPRETTWIAGVALLLIVLGFGLTGYLLPWDNRAYWGTVVTTQIAGQAPLFGAYMQQLIGAGSGVGSLTFARFYALHTLILPALAFTLVAIHVLLVLRHGVASTPDDTRRSRRFFPEQAFKDTLAIFAAFVILFALATVAQAPLGPVADPTDSNTNPRPEWYFLFLFQTLKLFKGTAEAVGSVLLPTLVVAALFAVPFVDRARMKRIRERTVAIGVVFLSATAWAALTIGAVLTEPRQENGSANRSSAPAWSRLPPGHLAGFGLFQGRRCGECHNIFEGTPKAGPNLGGLISAKTSEQLAAHFENPGAAGGAETSPPLDKIQIAALSNFLSTARPEQEPALLAAPPAMVSGARIVVENRCTRCHDINGAGGSTGPSLNGVAARRDKPWIEQHLKEPESQTPDTVMPSFDFSPADRDLLISYLFSLPKK